MYLRLFTKNKQVLKRKNECNKKFTFYNQIDLNRNF